MQTQVRLAERRINLFGGACAGKKIWNARRRRLHQMFSISRKAVEILSLKGFAVNT